MQFTEQGKLLWQQLEIAGLKAMFKGSDYLLIRDLDKAASAQATLCARAVDYPTLSEFMEQVNAGIEKGSSLSAQQNNLARLRERLQGLETGQVTARQVLGPGGTKKAARRWLNLKIARLEASIAAGGFDGVNISNYCYLLGSLVHQTATETNQSAGQ